MQITWADLASANRVTDVNADTVGLGSGVESRAIDVKNLPEHEHDLRFTQRCTILCYT